jgi:hypothetical protein
LPRGWLHFVTRSSDEKFMQTAQLHTHRAVGIEAAEFHRLRDRLG